MRFTKRTLKTLGIVLAVILLLIILFIRPVTDRPFQEREYYQSTLRVIEHMDFDKSAKQPIEVGWAKMSILPKKKVQLTGFHREVYFNIADSIYVRSFVFRNQEKSIVFLSFDLWFIHPDFAQMLKEAIQLTFPDIDGVYLSATHTHSSIGGWGSGLLGNLVIGDNDPEVKEFLISQSKEAIKQALKNASPSSLEFRKAKTEGLVKNRVNKENGTVDPWIRGLLFRKDSSVAALSTFSAHSVFIGIRSGTLSADYPGAYNDSLENYLDFSAFAAGTMGSHSPKPKRSYNNMGAYGAELAELFAEDNEQRMEDSTGILDFAEIPITMPRPQFRISNSLKLAPWLFNALMMDQEPEISVLRLGNTLLVGLPIELTGEYSSTLESMASEKGLDIIITLFNGSYLGYAPKSEYYYTVEHAETRSLNWYGPYTAEYYVAVIEAIIDRLTAESEGP